jgi:uncharacterized protein YqeY
MRARERGQRLGAHEPVGVRDHAHDPVAFARPRHYGSGMAIADELAADLKEAMRRKESGTVACIRFVKSKIQEAVTAKGFRGEADDDLHRRIIASYVKSLQKGIEELEAAGDRGRTLRDQYSAEIAYLERYLPKLLGVEETRDLVRRKLADLGVTDAKRSGQVVGAILKEHKGEVDPALVRRLVEEALASST